MNPIAKRPPYPRNTIGTIQHLRALEDQSVQILREAYKHLDDPVMLWSLKKKSLVLLWLVRKAFHGQVPFPFIYFDTGDETPELIEYRDRLCGEWHLNLVIIQNRETLKLDALKQAMTRHCWTSVILDIRADEERTRTDERHFSLHDEHGERDSHNLPPVQWDPSRRSLPDGSHIRVHPLLDWTERDIVEYLRLKEIPLPELNIWEYLELKQIPLSSLYVDRGNDTH